MSKLIIRAKTFKAWFNANLKDRAKDIASHGADAGYPCITYTVFDKFGDEIWEMAVSDADDMGEKNSCTMIAGFGRADMVETLDTFKNLMVWYACEKLAREMTEG